MTVGHPQETRTRPDRTELGMLREGLDGLLAVGGYNPIAHNLLTWAYKGLEST